MWPVTIYVCYDRRCALLSLSVFIPPYIVVCIIALLAITWMLKLGSSQSDPDRSGFTHFCFGFFYVKTMLKLQKRRLDGFLCLLLKLMLTRSSGVKDCSYANLLFLLNNKMWFSELRRFFLAIIFNFLDVTGREKVSSSQMWKYPSIMQSYT